MVSKSVHSTSNNKKTTSYKSFSDFKMSTISTAQRQLTQPQNNSQVSQFKATDKIQFTDRILCESNRIKRQQLTFTSVQFKNSLYKRIVAFIHTIRIMSQSLQEKKKNRKILIHNIVLPTEHCNGNKLVKSKLTFQMIGSYLRKDNFLVELQKQQTRINEVKAQVEDLQNIIVMMKGGFNQSQVIDLMNRINRIQDYCEFLYKVVEELQETFTVQASL